MSSAAVPEKWLTRGIAARVLGVCPQTLQKFMDDGSVTVLDVPGSRAKVPLSEVEQLRARFLRPARGKR
jgi:hypothetical protein